MAACVARNDADQFRPELGCCGANHTLDRVARCCRQVIRVGHDALGRHMRLLAACGWGFRHVGQPRRTCRDNPISVLHVRLSRHPTLQSGRQIADLQEGVWEACRRTLPPCSSQQSPSSVRQAEDTLGQDVELDLIRTTRDGARLGAKPVSSEFALLARGFTCYGRRPRMEQRPGVPPP